MKHSLWHIAGCLLPILFIFLLPVLGLGKGATFTVFIVLMFACHLFMMGNHGMHDDTAKTVASKSNPPQKKGGPSCH